MQKQSKAEVPIFIMPCKASSMLWINAWFICIGLVLSETLAYATEWQLISDATFKFYRIQITDSLSN